MKKALFTLNLDPDAYKDITDLTYFFLKHYANKIGAEFVVINERKFPEWPKSYEKLQIFELGQKMGNDWNIYFDCDALIHPDCPDITYFLDKDTVAHNGFDMAGIRWKYDRFFYRDGRHIGSASWLCIASDWCIELFEPCRDMTPEDVHKSIFPTATEVKHGVEQLRLVEDFVMSRNIAKYGLKAKMVREIFKDLNLGEVPFFWHGYAIPKDEKINTMKEVITTWGFAIEEVAE